MKIKKVKRLLAVVLCVVLFMSDGVLALADNLVDAATVSSGDVISTEEVISEISTEETAEIEEILKEAAEETAKETEESIVETVEETEEITSVDPIELIAEVDGTTIILSSPASSFAEGKTYTIEATIVEEEAELEVIEEALEEVAAEQNKVVEKYQAFDIKIFAEDENGNVEEFQPLGPVQVTFSGKEVAKSVVNEETETSVLHVDTETGETEDMEASTTEENDVAIETTHFSIYVVVDLETVSGTLDVQVEHWGTVKTIDGNGTYYGQVKEVKLNKETDKNGRRYGYYTVDNVFDITGGGAADNVNGKLVTITYVGELYTSDNITIPNEKRYDNVEELSKICLTSADKDYIQKNYLVDKIWVSDDLTNAGKDTWTAGSYREIVVTRDANGNVTNTDEIKLTTDSLIRFWYTEKKVNDKYLQSVTFYDHNVSNGENTQGADEGTNIEANFKLYGNTEAEYKMGVGQKASGNTSSWNIVQAYNKDGSTLGYLNYGNNWSEVAGVKADPNEYPLTKDGKRYAPYPVIVQGIVKDRLDASGNLQFNDNVKQPGFFVESSGTKKFTNFKLGFEQTGDTYVLSTVNKGPDEVLANLSTIKYSAHNNSSDVNIYSNEFWPLDTVSYPGMDATRPNASDDGGTHNWHFGMKYEFTFSVGDYTGPMNYYFRGDDDFWLFIDGIKVVDLGGIHSAVGEAVDIRAWMQSKGMLDDKNASHKITIYYMERGGYGSCCYMQFTLPNCKSVDSPSVPTTNYEVNKVWVDDSVSRPENISVELLRTDSVGFSTVVDTQTLNSENSWKYVWNGLPTVNVNNSSISYTYSAREVTVPEGYVENTSHDGNVTTITNTLVIDIPIEKIWNDQNNKYGIRSSEVNVRLKANDNAVKDSEGNDWILTLNEGNDWKGIWTSVPKCTTDNKLISYTVEEVTVPDGYSVEEASSEGLQPGDKGFIFTITNSLNVKSLKLIKYDAESSVALAGAKFKLESVTYPSITYEEYQTDQDGAIVFGELPYGTYKLTEVQAPNGYMVNVYHYHIIISEEGVIAASHMEGQGEPGPNEYADIPAAVAGEGATQIYVLAVANNKIYTLPSTGGSGIGIYTVSGVLLMCGAALILYKKKEEEEVLG